MLRCLRIAFSTVSVVAGLFLIALWMRSYGTRDVVFWNFYGANGVGVWSCTGRIVFSSQANFPSTGRRLWYVSHGGIIDWRKMRDRTEESISAYSGFGAGRRNGVSQVMIPHWFFVLLTAALASSPWWQREWRFSLRALLITTTLIAMALGLAVYGLRE